jgi:hypothetical protein
VYTWIWRHLPGRTGLKLTQALLLCAAVAALLLFVIFPIVEPHLPFDRATVGN